MPVVGICGYDVFCHSMVHIVRVRSVLYAEEGGTVNGFAGHMVCAALARCCATIMFFEMQGTGCHCFVSALALQGKGRGRLTVRLLDPSSSLDETQFLKDGQQVTWIVRACPC